jgi:phosphoenolpyruvate carboxylase
MLKYEYILSSRENRMHQRDIRLVVHISHLALVFAHISSVMMTLKTINELAEPSRTRDWVGLSQP